MLGVLLYGAEIWAPIQDLVEQSCCIMGISRTVQWKEQLTNAEQAGQFGMIESIDDLLTQYRLRWLGQVARMPDTRHPKKLLFGWLLQKRPAYGAELCWWDKILPNLKKCGISKSLWYMEVQDHTRWRTIDTKGLN